MLLDISSTKMIKTYPHRWINFGCWNFAWIYLTTFYKRNQAFLKFLFFLIGLLSLKTELSKIGKNYFYFFPLSIGGAPKDRFSKETPQWSCEEHFTVQESGSCMYLLSLLCISISSFYRISILLNFFWIF